MRRRRRKKLKREKIIMLCSSAFVLTALTMTGLYVKDKKQIENDGYVVDLSQLEPQTSETYESEEPKETPSEEVSSAKVKNQDNLLEDDLSYEMPWVDDFTEGDFVENDVMDYLVQEEEPKFSNEDSILWPIVGNVLINYSMEKPVYFSTLEQYKCSPAIVIEAKEGQNVMSSTDGIISKIEKTEELGNIITINVGNGYEMIYGQINNIQVKEGDRVSQGDYLADVAAPTKYYSVEGCNVYFAMKKDGNPINPMLQLENSNGSNSKKTS